MTIFDIKQTLDSIKILVDTREQDTIAFRNRMKTLPCGWKREKLDSGDYSCQCTMPSGNVFSLSDRRNRFIREFERLKNKNGKAYLLVENTSWDDIFAWNYRSMMNPNALVASLKAWEARYGAHILFCSSKLSGTLIYKTMYYELKELLESGDLDELAS